MQRQQVSELVATWAIGKACMLARWNETQSCKPNSIRPRRRFDSSKPNASANSPRNTRPSIAPMISMIPGSRRPQKETRTTTGPSRSEAKRLLALTGTRRTNRLAQDAKVCDCCGKPLADLGHTDDSEQIEIETTVYRRVIRRKRYRRLVTVRIGNEPSPRRCHRSSFPRASMARACGSICCWKSFTCSGQCTAPSSSFGFWE